ncbi:hypothetical protein ES319_A04G020300v1 [Gossypium barbadense]|uniref:Uncharacterized protein n=1 Tax=Gossypium barbadense TaxID=3634 RepID=A0A5J5W308_GOSBA|nr:hypothetical protein ES319_A04G020300v1 [Gossypium barbadense]
MVLSRKPMEASNTFFLVYIEVIVLLSLFNFQGHNWCGLTSPVGNDTDQEALLQFKAKARQVSPAHSKIQQLSAVHYFLLPNLEYSGQYLNHVIFFYAFFLQYT